MDLVTALPGIAAMFASALIALQSALAIWKQIRLHRDQRDEPRRATP